MVLSYVLSDRIIQIAHRYIGKQFDLSSFNCVHFVREVYAQVDITLPALARDRFPPRKFHLSVEEFSSMPIGHSVFFSRKGGGSARPWSHVAIIFSADTLIHCTRYLGAGVVITPKSAFLETYSLV